MSSTLLSEVMVRLRAETWDLHQQAELRPVEQALVRGLVTMPLYVHWLTQRVSLHLALEQALATFAIRQPRVRAVIDEPFRMARHAVRDLAHLSPSTRETLLPATMAAVARIEATLDVAPLRLLGAQYVVEGSKNCGRLLAVAVRHVLGLEQDGVSYLDPHGDEQPTVWDTFKKGMDALPLTTSDKNEVVAGARQTFLDIARIDEELGAQWLRQSGLQGTG